MVTCPQCDASRGVGDRFCRACGHPLSDPVPASSLTPPTALAGGQVPVAERRVCSVLFCDVVGFTPLSEARDPEAVREYNPVWGPLIDQPWTEIYVRTDSASAGAVQVVLAATQVFVRLIMG